MKKILACMLLSTSAMTAHTQTLTSGLDVGAMSATRDTATGVSVISAAITNTSSNALAHIKAVFRLYGPGDELVGTAEAGTDTLAAGQTWTAQAPTPLVFTRFTAWDISAH
jgi:hypothetical protein